MVRRGQWQPGTIKPLVRFHIHCGITTAVCFPHRECKLDWTASMAWILVAFLQGCTSNCIAHSSLLKGSSVPFSGFEGLCSDWAEVESSRASHFHLLLVLWGHYFRVLLNKSWAQALSGLWSSTHCAGSTSWYPSSLSEKESDHGKADPRKVCLKFQRLCLGLPAFFYRYDNCGQFLDLCGCNKKTE